MRSIIRTAILSAIFSIAILAAKAQLNYEFAVIQVHDNTRLLLVKHTTEIVSFQKGLDPQGELHRKVETMCKDGWEVYHTAPTFNSAGYATSHIYYLRRRLAD